MFRCDNSTGNCILDPAGTLTAAQCAGGCKCIVPHNCGQLNGTVVCGKNITTCNVCDTCCEFYILPQQNCNQCVNTTAHPVPGRTGGCGWPNMTR